MIAVLARPALAAGAPPDDVPVLSATPGQPLRFSVGDTVEVGRVTREGITEGDISLRRSPGRLEGRVGGEPIDVRLEPHRVAGSLGDRSIGLDISRSGEALQVAGTFGARSVAMQVQRTGIDAQMGPCSYRLALTVDHYRGVVNCGGLPVKVELTVPVALISSDDREVATMLTALLAR